MGGGWRIRDGLLEGADFLEAKAVGGFISPEIVVLHDTASRLEPRRAANYLANNSRKVSAHFVIELDGSLVQLVPVDRRANHAGRSNYLGRSGCNHFSIGIEIVNPGRMTRFNQAEAQAWYGERFDIEEYGIQEVETDEHGFGLWMPYREAQINTLITLLETLFDQITNLKDIVTHWYVSPGRKVDTNPLFPLEHVRSRIFGREDPVIEEAEERSYQERGDEYVEIDVYGDTLNMRRWPSFNPNVIARIPHGVAVPVVRRGVFEGRNWLKVIYGGQEGWIVASYAAPVMVSDPAGFHKGETQ
jgi:N-acetylmuramoyl-L-alanine amidase